MNDLSLTSSTDVRSENWRSARNETYVRPTTELAYHPSLSLVSKNTTTGSFRGQWISDLVIIRIEW